MMRKRGYFRGALLLLAATLPIIGCSMRTSRPSGVDVMRGPAPVRSSTPMENALACLKKSYPKGTDLRIGVGDITDGTGQMLTGDSNSRAFSQRPDMMMVVGLAKTGVRLVNRGQMAVAEWELKQAMEKRLGDGQRVFVDTKPFDYRPVKAGALLGSTHYVTGAITELNWNIKTKVNEVGVAGIQFGGKLYHISIAIDLVVTDTLTTEIVLTRSYNKQLVGDEYGAGLYRFFDVGEHGQFGPFELFQVNIGDKMNEPPQTALRWMIETAAYDIVGELTGLGETCDQLLPPGTLGHVEAARPTAAPASEKLLESTGEMAEPTDDLVESTGKAVDSQSLVPDATGSREPAAGTAGEADTSGMTVIEPPESKDSNGNGNGNGNGHGTEVKPAEDLLDSPRHRGRAVK